MQLPVISGPRNRESAKVALGTAMVVGSLASTEIVAPIVATIVSATLFMMAVSKIVDTVADALTRSGPALEPREQTS
jgi:predicted phage tail protein